MNSRIIRIIAITLVSTVVCITIVSLQLSNILRSDSDDEIKSENHTSVTLAKNTITQKNEGNLQLFVKGF